MNFLLSSLSVYDLGCHINDVYIGCLVYADDIILLSASVVHLQTMLDICYTQGVEVDIIFNAQKSALFVVSKAHDVLIDPLWIGHHQVSWHHINILNIWESSLSQVEFCGLIMILLSENFMLLLMLFVVM